MSKSPGQSDQRLAQVVPMGMKGTILFGAFIVIALLGGAGVWGATAQLSSAVVAQGYVTVDTNRKAVQHAEGGTVRRILARDGDTVELNAPLVILDDAAPQANYRILRSGFDAMTATEARLRAEQDNLPEIVFPQSLLERSDDPVIAELIAGQRRLFEARRGALQGEREILEQRVQQLYEEIVGLEAQLSAKTRQINFILDELKGLKTLYEQRLAAITRVLALEREHARLEGERGELAARIARTKTTIGETRLQILQLERKFREDVVTERREIQNKLIDVAERVNAAEITLRRLVIRAPVSGVVVSMSVHNVDAVISPGDTIAEIVPQEDDLVIEARIKPSDIDNLVIGQEADVRVTAFNQRTTPIIKGRFAYVSADRLTDNRSGEAYYLARVHVEAEELGKLGDQKLIPGMPTEVIIKTGARTALDYILQPIVVGIGKAWREE